MDEKKKKLRRKKRLFAHQTPHSDEGKKIDEGSPRKKKESFGCKTPTQPIYKHILCLRIFTEKRPAKLLTSRVNPGQQMFRKIF